MLTVKSFIFISSLNFYFKQPMNILNVGCTILIKLICGDVQLSVLRFFELCCFDTDQLLNLNHSN